MVSPATIIVIKSSYSNNRTCGYYILTELTFWDSTHYRSRLEIISVNAVTDQLVLVGHRSPLCTVRYH